MGCKPSRTRDLTGHYLTLNYYFQGIKSSAMSRYCCFLLVMFLFSCTHPKKQNETEFLLERDVPLFIDALKDISQSDKAKAFEQMRTALQYELVERPTSPGVPEAQSPLRRGMTMADGQLTLFVSSLLPHSDANEFAVELLAYPPPAKGIMQELAEKKLGKEGMTLKDGKAQWKIKDWVLTVGDHYIAWSAVSDKSVYDYFEDPFNALPDTVDINDNTDHTEEPADKPVTKSSAEPGAAPEALNERWPQPTAFSAIQLITLQRAWDMANASVHDSLFKKILLQMSAAKEIEWGPKRVTSIPASQRANPGAFIISEFDKRGLLALNRFQAMLYSPGSPTTGSTLPCDSTINVNVNKLTRSLADIAGTMVHERVHSFCQKHNNNKRKNNICDMAYISGSLSIAIHYYRANGSVPVRATESLCPALDKRLRAMGIIQ